MVPSTLVLKPAWRRDGICALNALCSPRAVRLNVNIVFHFKMDTDRDTEACDTSTDVSFCNLDLKGQIT